MSEILLDPCPTCGARVQDIKHEGADDNRTLLDGLLPTRIQWLDIYLVPCGHTVDGYSFAVDGEFLGWGAP